MKYDIGLKELRRMMYELWSSGKLSEIQLAEIDGYSKRRNLTFCEIQQILSLHKELFGSSTTEGSE